MALALGHSALLNSIADIIGIRTNKEMRWIYTERIIATMADMQAVWYRAKM